MKYVKFERILLHLFSFSAADFIKFHSRPVFGRVAPRLQGAPLKMTAKSTLKGVPRIPTVLVTMSRHTHAVHAHDRRRRARLMDTKSPSHV